jgi:hypothetical protein
MDEIMKASAELDGIVPELWSAAFYPTLLEALPFNASVARDYEGEIQALGDTVHINQLPQFDVATEMQEGDANPADGVTVSKQSLIINKQLAKDFIITKKAMRQSIDSMNALRDLALHSILKKMQQIIITETVPSASSPDHAISFTSGTTLALADILAAKELLDTADIEESGRTMVLGAAQWNDLFNITGFVSRDFLPSANAMSSGAIATPLLGFLPKWTTAAGNTSYFFHPLYLQMAVQQAPEVEVLSLGADGKRATRVNMDVLFGVKLMSNIRVVTVS